MEHFEKAGNYAMKCGNKANVQLLHEAEQCLRAYLEKQVPDSAKKSDDNDSDEHEKSDDDLHETQDSSH
jgi:hypothetical protein